MKSIFKLILICFLFLGGYSLSRFYMIRVTMQKDKLEKEYKNLINESRRMEFRIEDLKSLGRFEALAFDSFKMRYPSGEDYESCNEKYTQR
ncbi:MAG: hypothetical protein PHW02_03125 [bacterium]|nr:hypothetical protein [bacterium]